MRRGTLYLVYFRRNKQRAAARAADYRFVVMFFGATYHQMHFEHSRCGVVWPDSQKLRFLQVLTNYGDAHLLRKFV